MMRIMTLMPWMDDEYVLIEWCRYEYARYMNVAIYSFHTIMSPFRFQTRGLLHVTGSPESWSKVPPTNQLGPQPLEEKDHAHPLVSALLSSASHFVDHTLFPLTCLAFLPGTAAAAPFQSLIPFFST